MPPVCGCGKMDMSKGHEGFFRLCVFVALVLLALAMVCTAGCAHGRNHNANGTRNAGVDSVSEGDDEESIGSAAEGEVGAAANPAVEGEAAAEGSGAEDDAGAVESPATADKAGAAANPITEDEEAMTEYTMEPVEFTRDGLRICGHLYLPESQGPNALVIIGHGFGGNMMSVEEYARFFARNNIAACVFDFVGGGYNIQSDGELTDMSVLTEAADMNVVMDELAVRPDDVRGLVLLYPAYVLQDDAWARTLDPSNIPEYDDVLGTTVGRVYTADILTFDIYDVMSHYTGPVLIIHGTDDSIVPIQYSRRAVEVMPNAELVEIAGADHGFMGADDQQARSLMLAFVQEHSA